MIAERGLVLTYQTIRNWCLKFGTLYAKKLKAKKDWGDRWYMDEVYCRVGGEMVYLWRAVDQDDQTLEILVQRKRNRDAAERLLRKLRKHGDSPRKVVTDKLKSYIKPCQKILPNAEHTREKGGNYRAENSHQPTRLREAKMRGFKSMKQAQRFLSIFGSVYDHFQIARHRTSANVYRILLNRNFEFWQSVVQNPYAA
jgi:putative transposase